MITKGKHGTVQHGDIMDRVKMNAFLGNSKVGIFYSDPPWDNLKYWNTLNNRQNGLELNVNQMPLDDFLNEIFFRANKHTEDFVCIEYGLKWEGMIHELAAKYNWHLAGRVIGLYSSQNRPLVLLVFHVSKPVKVDLTNAHHLKGVNFVYTVFEAILKSYNVQNKTVMDLCCGMGYSLRAAIKNDMKFIGNELNLHRLKKTIKIL